MTTNTQAVPRQALPDYGEQVEAVLAAARARGVEAEVFVQRSTATSVRVLKGEVEQFSLADTTGLGVRVLVEGRVGYAYTEHLTTENALKAFEEALGNAKLLPVSEHVALHAFEGQEVPALSLYDPTLEEFPVERKVERALALEQACYDRDPRVKNVTHAGFADSTSLLRVANTRGLDRSYVANLAWIGCMPIAAENDQNKNAYKSRASRDLAELDPDRVAREAVDQAVSRLNAREVPSGTYDVLFTAEAFADLLGTFCGVFSAKLAQEGKSLLAGKLGQQVASPVFTLTDDPLRAEGFATRPFDDEGCPSARHVLVEAGTFRTFLHNTETARKDRVASTGHAARSYKGTVGVAPSNLVVTPGSRPPSALLGDRPGALEVDEVTGLHAGANAISGDFSLQAQGFLRVDGERVPVHNFTVAGNFLTLLSAIREVADDVEVFPGGTCLITPSVLVEGLAIAGA